MTESQESKPSQILKIHFGLGRDGRWSIDGLFGMALKPCGDQADGFFRIHDGVLAEQAGLLGTTSFFLGQSIVPVVVQIPGERSLRCLGTGFFVSCSGLLVTAAHVITDPVEKKYGGVRELDDRSWHLGDLRLGVMIPLNPLLEGRGYLFRDIEWAGFLGERKEHPLRVAGATLTLSSDTAICRVSPIAQGVPHQPLAIVQPSLVGVGLGVGKNAMAVGYGEMRHVELTGESGRVLSGDFPFHLHVSEGAILERFPDNLSERRVPTPGPCFSAALRLPPGMSGSPIFDDEGIYVHGVVSRGWLDEGGIARFGFGSMLAAAMQVPIKPLGNRTLLELQESDEHGFPKLQGPGL